MNTDIQNHVMYSYFDNPELLNLLIASNFI